MDVGLFLFFIGKWLYRRVIFFRGLCNALFLKLCLLIVVALPLAAAGIIYLAVDSAPRSIAPPRSRRRISSTPNAFSNKTIPDSLNLARRTIWVSASDLDLAANYLSRQYAAGERRKIAGVYARERIHPALWRRRYAEIQANDGSDRAPFRHVAALPLKRYQFRDRAMNDLNCLNGLNDLNGLMIISETALLENSPSPSRRHRRLTDGRK